MSGIHEKQPEKHKKSHKANLTQEKKTRRV